MAAQYIVILEDHGLIAHTLAAALTRTGKTVEVFQPPEEGDLLTAFGAHVPDLVLLDLDLGPWGDATSLIGPVAAAGVPVLMVTGVEDPARKAACIAAGAVGVVSKSLGFDELFEAITRTLRDGTLLTEHERQEQLALLRAHERAERDRLAPFEELSQREAHVLGELMAGRSVDEVATASFVSVTTIRTQIRAILTKLGVSSQVAAIGRAREAGWVPPQERSPDS